MRCKTRGCENERIHRVSTLELRCQECRDRLPPAFDQAPPPRHGEELLLFVHDGCEPGSFLRALLANDLVEAFGQADLENQVIMHEWASFLRWGLPSVCWGSRGAVERWISAGGWSGIILEERAGLQDLLAAREQDRRAA